MADYDTLAGRLRTALTARSMTAAALARECGLTKQNFQRFLSGNMQRSKHLPALARALSVEVSWLTMGDPHTAPLWCGAGITDRPPVRSTNGESVTKSPLHGLGMWKKSWSTVRMRGTGGRPLAEDGDHLIIDTGQPPAPGHLLLVSSEGRPFLKRHGGILGNQVLLAGVDRGFFQEAVRVSRLRDAQVVVGIVFAGAPFAG